MQSMDFISGRQGWKLDPRKAEFQNISIGQRIITIDPNVSISSAIAELDAEGGGILYLKPGTYIVTSALTGISSIQIVGTSKNTTTIVFVGAANLTFNNQSDIEISEVTITGSTGTALSFVDCTDVLLEDVTLAANNKGLSLNNCDFVDLTRVVVASSTANGAEITDCQYLNATGFSLASNGGHGLVMDGNTTVNLKACASTGNTGDGYNLTDTTDTVLEVAAATNGGQGIELVSGNVNVMMDKCLVAANTSDGIKLTATSDYCRIINSYLAGNGGYGVNIAAATCDKNTVALNALIGNTTGSLNDSGTATISANNQT